MKNYISSIQLANGVLVKFIGGYRFRVYENGGYRATFEVILKEDSFSLKVVSSSVTMSEEAAYNKYVDIVASVFNIMLVYDELAKEFKEEELPKFEVSVIENGVVLHKTEVQAKDYLEAVKLFAEKCLDPNFANTIVFDDGICRGRDNTIILATEVKENS